MTLPIAPTLPTLARSLAIGLLLVGCNNRPIYEGAFDVPTAMGVLQNENGGPFDEPIAFVGNEHGGQISILALKQGRFVTDNAAVSYLRGNGLATGQRRVLTALFPYAQDDRIDVFALDAHFDHIVQIPYVTGIGEFGAPIRPITTASAVSFEDVDGSGDSPTLSGLQIKTGWTATEDWTITFDGDGWLAEGSRSGRMQRAAEPGEHFVGVRRAIAYRVEGEATVGDRFVLSTDTGSREHDAGGKPLGLAVRPDGQFAAVIVQTPAAAQIRMLDPRNPESFASSPPLPLPAGAAPNRMAWTADGTRLFASDPENPVVWELRFEEDALDTIIGHPLPFATVDVAPMIGDAERLHLVPFERNDLWVYDLGTETLLDANPWRPGVQGLTMDGAINGIASMPIPYLQLERSDFDIRRTGRAVAVTLASGAVVFAHEDTGCLVQDGGGPRTRIDGSFGALGDYNRSFERLTTNGPFLQQNGTNTRHALGNPCGGVTRTQEWLLRYDQLQQAWVVTGNLSGEQESLAYEDVRYTSDDGEVSFVIRSGGDPSEDGWFMRFDMVDGTTAAEGDNNGDGGRDVVLDNPSDPLYFHYLVGGDDGRVRPVDDRPHVLVAGRASDRVGRVMPNEGRIDSTWD